MNSAAPGAPGTACCRPRTGRALAGCGATCAGRRAGARGSGACTCGLAGSSAVPRCLLLRGQRVRTRCDQLGLQRRDALSCQVGVGLLCELVAEQVHSIVVEASSTWRQLERRGARRTRLVQSSAVALRSSACGLRAAGLRRPESGAVARRLAGALGSKLHASQLKPRARRPSPQAVESDDVGSELLVLALEVERRQREPLRLRERGGDAQVHERHGGGERQDAPVGHRADGDLHLETGPQEAARILGGRQELLLGQEAVRHGQQHAPRAPRHEERMAALLPKMPDQARRHRRRLVRGGDPTEAILELARRAQSGLALGRRQRQRCRHHLRHPQRK